MHLAEKKGRFLYEFVDQITEDEVHDWLAFYEQQHKAQERAMEEQKRKSQLRGHR